MAGDNKAKVSSFELLLNPSLTTLFSTRTLDPMATTSIYSYMFSQLKWMSPDASDVEIATQAGLLTASKMAAKVCTNMLWGRLSDKPYGGRRMVLLIGLFTSCLSTAGYGFATSFGQAMFWQAVSGALNSSIGIIRCMVGEIEKRPSHRSRALLLVPFSGSIGQLLGPLLGGFLTTLSRNVGGLFNQYPYALPNIVIASLYAACFVACFFMVDETLETFNRSRGSGFKQCALRLWAFITRRNGDEHTYTALPVEEDDTASEMQESPISARNSVSLPEAKPRDLTFWQIWTPQVCCTLLAHFIISGHVTTFSTTWSIFLASPISQASYEDSAPVSFTGGVGLDPAQIGILASIFALLGVLLQTWLPSLSDRFGILAVWRTALFFFPVAYLISPFPALFASHAGKVVTWASLAVINTVFILGRTGAQPAMTLLINNAVPGPTASGTINVAGTVVGNLSRGIMPVALMALYGWGYQHNLVVAGFWALSALSLLAIVASRWVKLKPETESVDRTVQDEESGDRVRS